jgi:hypothetical protein
MIRINYNRRQFSGPPAPAYDNPKKMGRPLRRAPKGRLDLQELEKQAARLAKETGEPLSAVRLRWRIDELMANQGGKRDRKNDRKGKTATVASTARVGRQRATAVDLRDGFVGQPAPDDKLRILEPRSHTKTPLAKRAAVSSNRQKATAAPAWSSVEVKYFYADGTSLETYKARVLVADPDTVVLRVRGKGKINYRLNKRDAGDRAYHLDTGELGRTETLQFMRGRKRLFGTWRTKSSAGGWSVVISDA